MNDPLVRLLGAFGMIILLIAMIYICLWVIPQICTYTPA